MASLQQRRGWFHPLFRCKGKQHSHALKTKDRREAEALRELGVPVGVARPGQPLTVVTGPVPVGPEQPADGGRAGPPA